MTGEKEFFVWSEWTLYFYRPQCVACDDPAPDRKELSRHTMRVASRPAKTSAMFLHDFQSLYALYRQTWLDRLLSCLWVALPTKLELITYFMNLSGKLSGDHNKFLVEVPPAVPWSGGFFYRAFRAFYIAKVCWRTTC